MLREDNNGFINFPIDSREISKVDSGKTFVYLVAFDVEDFINSGYDLSNINLIMRGNFISDDISMRSRKDFKKSLIDGSDRYFPNTIIKESEEVKISIPLTSCICIGWSESMYEMRGEDMPWCATFRDLTPEGRKLYYSIKKLHNTKEVRILTFDSIK